MSDTRLVDDDEEELRALVRPGERRRREGILRLAECAGLADDTYFPEEGVPNDQALERCAACRAQIACLATGVLEDRSGWWGGKAPSERAVIAARLGVNTLPDRGRGVVEDVDEPSPVTQARRLQDAGYTVPEIAERLGCCARTVQRRLNRSGRPT